MATVLVLLSSWAAGAAGVWWNGGESRDWNTTATNWLGRTGALTNLTYFPTNFTSGDTVFFGDAAAGDVFIGSNGVPGSVAPGTVYFNPTNGYLNGYRVSGGDITSGAIQVHGTTVMFVGYSNSLSFPGGLRFYETPQFYPHVSFDLSRLAPGSFHLGTGPITFAARASGLLSFPASNTSGIFTLENDLNGSGMVQLPEGTNVAVRLTGTVRLQGSMMFSGSFARQGQIATNDVAGAIEIDQRDGGDRVLAENSWYWPYKNLLVSGVISDGAGPYTNPLTLSTYGGGIVIGGSNTYAGGTRIRSSGAPAGPVIVLPGATLGTGDVDASTGMLVLTDRGNISSNATLRWGYRIGVMNGAKVRVASAFNGVALPPGVYTSNNTAYFEGDGSIRVPSTNMFPSITVMAPTNGAAMRDDEVVRFRVQPSDVDGFIQRVDFYLDGVKVRERTNAPFSISLTNIGVGSHRLQATVFDDDGGSAVSSMVGIHVRTRLTPTVSTNGAVVRFPAAAKTLYVLQSTPTLLPPAWSNVATFEHGPERVIQYTNDTQPQPPTLFYRVITP